MSAHNVRTDLNKVVAGGGLAIQILDGGAKPADGAKGYCAGCLLIIAAGDDKGAYVNKGTVDGANFDVITAS